MVWLNSNKISINVSIFIIGLFTTVSRCLFMKVLTYYKNTPYSNQNTAFMFSPLNWDISIHSVVQFSAIGYYRIGFSIAK